MMMSMMIITFLSSLQVNDVGADGAAAMVDAVADALRINCSITKLM